MTPGRISLTRLANRITWKLANLYSNDEDDDHHIERLRNKSEQKQVKAELIRKDLETSRKEFFLREREKQAEVRERLEEKKMKVVEKHARKLDEAQEVRRSTFFYIMYFISLTSAMRKEYNRYEKKLRMSQQKCMRSHSLLS
mgnify:CR=1 FL=1